MSTSPLFPCGERGITRYFTSARSRTRQMVIFWASVRPRIVSASRRPTLVFTSYRVILLLFPAECGLLGHRGHTRQPDGTASRPRGRQGLGRRPLPRSAL